MNRFAYLTTSLAVKTLCRLSKAHIKIYGKKNIPDASTIFVVNHFTRVETLFLPQQIHTLTQTPVWSLADYGLFEGTLGKFLDLVGAVSTKDPDRDLLIVKSLLTGEAKWIIFPEGRMVKSKKVIEKGWYMISYAGGKHPPHTGAATLAIRTEFYRKRLRYLFREAPGEAEQLASFFQIDSIDPVLATTTCIVPVNITYYPIRAYENIVSNFLVRLMEDVPERVVEEIMAEGTMLLSGVDVEIRFGKAIEIKGYMTDPVIERDVSSMKQIGFNDAIPSKPLLRKRALDITQRYMSAIYGMTTVNHDHLFASILKLYPFHKINEYDLRRRVFLAATGPLKRRKIYLHKDLHKDQVHLLTDDRFNKFRDFVSLALEKGLVKKQGTELVKESAKFSSRFDFHRIRIENPVEVIANEIEPLPRLQRRMRCLAWQPGFWQRRKVARLLLKRDCLEFERDYETYYVEKESKKKEVGRPFLIRGHSRDTGVLLVHGYMAAPLEVKELAEYLGRRGLWVYVPRLRGHGTSPNDLAQRSFTEWIVSVDRGYAVMRNLCRRVVVGGFSTGAGLALDVAARVNGIKGVFAVSPPIRLQDISSKFAPAVGAWNRWMDVMKLDGAKMEFVENKPENPHINYFRNPVSGVRELDHLMHTIEPKLGDIRAPALVVQSDGDPVVNPKGSRRVFDLLGSENKQFILFHFKRHGILLGEGADRVHRAIGEFIDQLR